MLTERPTAKAAAAGKALILVIGFALGWGAHALRQYQHTYTLSGLTVLEHGVQIGEYHLLINSIHRDFHTRFCEDYIPHFPNGAVITELVYEDRGGCWSISDSKLGYILARR